jgi:methionyl-tRNA synthetase
VVPEPGELTSEDKALLETVEKGFDTVSAEFEAVHLRAALAEVMRIATEVNKYLDTTAPWKVIKTDRQAAARSIYTALRAIDSLKIMFAPFLPFSSEKLHQLFGYDLPLFGTQSTQAIEDQLAEHTVLRYHPESAAARWESSQLKPGTKINPPAPLFRKLEPEIIEQERARLGK